MICDLSTPEPKLKNVLGLSRFSKWGLKGGGRSRVLLYAEERGYMSEERGYIPEDQPLDKRIISIKKLAKIFFYFNLKN